MTNQTVGPGVGSGRLRDRLMSNEDFLAFAYQCPWWVDRYNPENVLGKRPVDDVNEDIDSA